MIVFYKICLAILIFLAVSSGVTKMLLMPQDVEFFSAYGFTDTMLILFGACQIIGGILMIATKTRMGGAVIVALTFVTSAILLFMAANILVGTITLLATAALLLIANKKIS